MRQHGEKYMNIGRILTSDAAIMIYEMTVIVTMAVCIRMLMKAKKKMKEEQMQKKELAKENELQRMLANDKRREER